MLWVHIVVRDERAVADAHQKNLRYKDYQLASRPAEVTRDSDAAAPIFSASGLYETDSVKDFGRQMQDRGVHNWWRKAMGYAGQDDHL